MKEQIFKILDKLNIDYKNYQHKPTFTCDEARGVNIPGRRVKSLFIRNKKATQYYMVVLEDDKRFDSNLFRKSIGENKISFASKERMIDKIGVEPGHVSPFALINNLEHDIKVIFNKSLKDVLIGFHPGQNDNTVVLNMGEVEKFLGNMGNEFIYLEL